MYFLSHLPVKQKCHCREQQNKTCMFLFKVIATYFDENIGDFNCHFVTGTCSSETQMKTEPVFKSVMSDKLTLRCEAGSGVQRKA